MRIIIQIFIFQVCTVYHDLIDLIKFKRIEMQDTSRSLN